MYKTNNERSKMKFIFTTEKKTDDRTNEKGYQTNPRIDYKKKKTICIRN